MPSSSRSRRARGSAARIWTSVPSSRSSASSPGRPCTSSTPRSRVAPPGCPCSTRCTCSVASARFDASTPPATDSRAARDGLEACPARRSRRAPRRVPLLRSDLRAGLVGRPSGRHPPLAGDRRARRRAVQRTAVAGVQGQARPRRHAVPRPCRAVDRRDRRQAARRHVHGGRARRELPARQGHPRQPRSCAKPRVTRPGSRCGRGALPHRGERQRRARLGPVPLAPHPLDRERARAGRRDVADTDEPDLRSRGVAPVHRARRSAWQPVGSSGSDGSPGARTA